MNNKKILGGMRASPQNVRFADICKVCERYFGKPRQKGTSHRIYGLPWPDDPMINVQNDRGKAKAYQVRQVLRVIARLEKEDEDKR